MTGKRSYSSVCTSPGTAWFAYACSSTASVSNFTASRKNAGYRARATSSFISCNTPRAQQLIRLVDTPTPSPCSSSSGCRRNQVS